MSRPHTIFEVGGFAVTNHHIMTLAAAVLMVVVFAYVASRVRVKADATEEYVTKGRVAQLFEVILEFFREQVARPALGDLADRYIGFIWTTFFFILFCNLLGILPVGPIAQLFGGNGHLGGTATGNISVTMGLAIVSFFAIQGLAIRHLGIVGWLKHHCPGPAYLAPLMFVLELMGDLVKPFALCVRLFANMVAGHMVLGALIALIFLAGNAGLALGYGTAVPSIAMAVALSLLELFVAFLQAFIFTFLTVLFIAQFVMHEDHEEHAGPHDHEGHHVGELLSGDAAASTH